MKYITLKLILDEVELIKNNFQDLLETTIQVCTNNFEKESSKRLSIDDFNVIASVLLKTSIEEVREEVIEEKEIQEGVIEEKEVKEDAPILSRPHKTIKRAVTTFGSYGENVLLEFG